MGIKIRKKGAKWYLFIDYQGKRKAKCVGTRAAAEQVKRMLEAKLALGDFSFLKSEKPASFADYAEGWVKQYVDLKPSTAARYKGLLKLHILPFLGSKAIDAITRDDVKQFFSALALKQVQPKSKNPEKIDPNRKTLAANSLQNALICLRVIFQSALEDGLIPQNPASKVGRFLRKDTEKFEAVFLTRKELERFLDSIRTLTPEYYPLFLTFARTGLRLGEALALRWGDIQFAQDEADANRYMSIRRNYTAGRLVTPKSNKSRRVDMSRQLRAVLLEIREQRLLEAMLKDEFSISEEPVFPSPSGKMLDASNLRKRVLLPAIQHAGLRRFRIHDLRHTFASLLIQDGTSLAYVKEQLGHSSIAITVDLYGHLVPSANIAFVDRLDGETSPQQNATQAQPTNDSEEAEYSEVFENSGGPGQSRTADLRFRKPLLYPSELQGHKDLRSRLAAHPQKHPQTALLLDFSIRVALDSQQNEQLRVGRFDGLDRLHFRIVSNRSVILAHLGVHVAGKTLHHCQRHVLLSPGGDAGVPQLIELDIGESGLLTQLAPGGVPAFLMAVWAKAFKAASVERVLSARMLRHVIGKQVVFGFPCA